MWKEHEGHIYREPQHGVDYLVDYYALLGVKRDADADEIKDAFRDKLQKYHPDKYAHLAEEYQASAKARTKGFLQANETLTNADKRAAYDTQLAEWKGAISTNGMPIIDLTQPAAVYDLLFDNVKEAGLQAVLERAQQMSGYDPKIFAFIEQQYTSTEAPSSELTNAYAEALRQRDVHLSLQESFRRQVIGLNPELPSSPPEAYLETTMDELNRGRQEMQVSIDTTLLQIQSGEVRLIGAVDPIMEAITTDPNAALVHYKANALANYDKQAAAIENIAAEREAVIEKRLALVTGEYVYGQSDRTDRLVLKFTIHENTIWQAFHLDGTAIQPDPSFPAELFETLDEPEQAQALITQGYTIMHLTHQEGLPVTAELQAAVIKHYESLPEEQNA